MEKLLAVIMTLAFILWVIWGFFIFKENKAYNSSVKIRSDICAKVDGIFIVARNDVFCIDKSANIGF